MKLRIPERMKVGLMVIAIAMAWSGLWYLTMPIYPRFWQLKTLPVYGFILFLAFGIVSLPLYGLGNRPVSGVFHILYWLPIGLGILISVIWGLSATP
jgi:hypothetical protein